jgi:hypothetical protein
VAGAIWLSALLVTMAPIRVLADQVVDPLESMAESLPPGAEPVMEAVARFLRTDLEQWRYRRSASYRETVRVDRHEPTRPGAEHWQLVSIDGREPTEEEWEEYRDDRADHSGDGSERLGGDYVASIVIPGSMRREPAAQGLELWSFRLQSPDGRFERSYERMRGDLRLVRDEHGVYADRVRVWNERPFRPFLGVRMDRLFLDFRFVPEQEHVLPVAVEMELEGRALWIKEVGRRISVRMSGFELVSPPGAGVGP